jgi:hypothetical protein
VSGAYDPWWTTNWTNCVFVGNTSDSGAIIQVYVDPRGLVGGPPHALTMTNCSFTNNTTGEDDAVVELTRSTSTFINTILWDGGSQEIDGWYITTVTQCNIMGGFEGEGNIDVDPMFVSPENGNLRLKKGSPCIDTGTLDGAPETDIAGIARPIGFGVDMGAYEFIDTDIDDNGTVNAIDVQLVINAALGIPIDPFDADIDQSGETNATDVQLVINAALGL